MEQLNFLQPNAVTVGKTSERLVAEPGRMQGVTWPQRFDNYRRVIGRSPHLHQNEDDGWVEGYWLFNDYSRHSTYHGAYMRHLMKRYSALFYDRRRTVHVCSGSLQPDNPWLPGDTVDCNPSLNPTYCTDAQTCAGVPLHKYDIAYVDVPYSDADAKIYGCPMLSRKRVLETLIYGLPTDAMIVWLDEVGPTTRREWPLKWEGVWGVSTSAGHRDRTVRVYRKVGAA
jgi:hypothetical protein